MATRRAGSVRSPAMSSPGAEAARPLAGKTILLVMPAFFGYDLEIERVLTGWGATVHRYENRPSVSAGYKALLRLLPWLAQPAADRYFRRMFERHAHERIDWFLVIRGEALSRALVARFTALFPRAKRILYLWDSLAHDPPARARLPGFEAVYTFDPQDARRERGLQLLPLFFVPRFAALRGRAQDLALSFVGTVHGDRYPVVRAVRDALAPHVPALFFLYCPSRGLFWLRRVFDARLRGAKPAEFSFRPLRAEAVADVFARSGAILDVHRGSQSGLTMRTLEALGAQRKLVTTNAGVRDYDFYDARNIAVISREEPRLPPGFLEAPFRETPPELLERYSVEHWLRTLLGLAPLANYLKSGSASAASPVRSAG